MKAKDQRKYFEQLRSEGWGVERTRKGAHMKLTPPWPGAELVYVSCTTSDWRSFRNVMARVSRIEKTHQREGNQ